MNLLNFNFILLDIKTIFICLFIINIILAIFIFVIKKTQKTFYGLDEWLIANTFIGFGYLLLAGRETISDFLSIVLAQALFISAGFLRIFGLNKFFNKKTSRNFYIFSIVSVIFYITVIYYLSIINENIFVRTFIVGIVLSSMSVFTGVLVLKNKEESENYLYKLTAFTFFIFAFIFLFRITGWILFPSIRNLFSTSIFNSVQFLASLIIDITWMTMFFILHNQRLTKEIKNSEERFRTVFEANSSPLILIDINNDIELVNEAYCVMVGQKKNELLGKNLETQIEKNDYDKFQEVKDKLLSNNYKFNEKYEIMFLDKLGEHRVTVATFAYLQNINKIVISAIDITDMKHYQEQLHTNTIELKKLNSDKDLFMSILAHDLVSPFNAILGYSNILIKNIENFNKEIFTKQLEIIHTSASNTYNLLKELLDWSRAQSGKVPFHPKELNFFDCADKVIKSFEISSHIKNITLKNNSPLDTFVFADENMLSLIIRNLLNNAIKFTNKGGTVTVNISKSKDAYIISIIDTGIGMEKAVVDKLWNTITHSTPGTENEKGHGLGLSLIKTFVENHNGKIWVESEVGKGSNFSFSLPFKPE